jgi:hypothetical protein
VIDHFIRFSHPYLTNIYEPQQRFVDPINDRYRTLPFYDERHFEDMHTIMSVEPANPQDKVMMGMLASLGIEKGKPFAPDETTKRAMRQAAIDAWFYVQQWFDNIITKERLYWPDRHYASVLMTDGSKPGQHGSIRFRPGFCGGIACHRRRIR